MSDVPPPPQQPYGQQPPPPPQQPYGQQPPQPGYGGSAAPQPMSPADEKLWATLTHVGVIVFMIPVLIAYLVLKDRGPFIRAHTTTALNFAITLAIAHTVSWLLMFVLIGFILLPAVIIVQIVFAIIAAIAANKGQFYTYPVAFKFLK